MQEAMHIFDVLGLPEQVAYYQEHYEKFSQIREKIKSSFQF